MGKTTAQMSAGASSANGSAFESWVRVTSSSALLGCIGGVLGSTLLFGVIYARITGWHGPISLEQYFTVRDIAESITIALFVLWGYRRLPAMHDAMQTDAGVLRVSAIVGSLTLIVFRMIVYKTGLKLD